MLSRNVSGVAMTEEMMTHTIIAFEKATQEAIAALDPTGGLQYDADSVCDVCREVTGTS